MRQWFELGKNASAGLTFGVEIIAILEAFNGPTRVPGEGMFAIALDSITIQPEHEVEGMVKFPLYVEPAASCIVSPQVAAFIAL